MSKVCDVAMRMSRGRDGVAGSPGAMGGRCSWAPAPVPMRTGRGPHGNAVRFRRAQQWEESLKIEKRPPECVAGRLIRFPATSPVALPVDCHSRTSPRIAPQSSARFRRSTWVARPAQRSLLRPGWDISWYRLSGFPCNAPEGSELPWHPGVSDRTPSLARQAVSVTRPRPPTETSNATRLERAEERALRRGGRWSVLR